MTFAERLLSLRKKRGYTQEQLAALCGLSQSTIASYESGNRLHTRNLFSLAHALGVTPLWLEKGKGQPFVFDEPPLQYANWPFSYAQQADFNALTSQEQQMVDKVLQTLISQLLLRRV